MKLRYGATIAFLVLLAGCGGILGGDGTATPPSATQPVTTTATWTPTPVATTMSTPSATPTPLPDTYTRQTVTNETHGLTVDLVGPRETLRSLLVRDVTGIPVTRGAVLQCARASPFIAVSTNGSVADVTATMSYDPTKLPPGANESELSVFVYNRTVQFYLEMETTIDAANDTATGTQVVPGQAFTRETESGTQRVEPGLDGTRLDNAFVVMHAPTWWEAVETREVPPRCVDNTPTPAEGTATDTSG